jgi:hypothetical protein
MRARPFSFRGADLGGERGEFGVQRGAGEGLLDQRVEIGVSGCGGDTEAGGREPEGCDQEAEALGGGYAGVLVLVAAMRGSAKRSVGEVACGARRVAVALGRTLFEPGPFGPLARARTRDQAVGILNDIKLDLLNNSFPR